MVKKSKRKTKKPLSQKALDARAHNFAIFQVAGAMCALLSVAKSPKASARARRLALIADTRLHELKEELRKNNQVES